VERCNLNAASERRPEWKSDRIVVPMKPSNFGGGKSPDFWYVSQEDKDQVIDG
jgi:hypothetical protein